MIIDLVGPSFPFRGGISHYTTLLFKHLKEKQRTNFYCLKRQYPRIFYPGKTDLEESQVVLKDEDALPVLDALNPLSWLDVAVRVIKDRPDLTIFPWWVVYWTLPFLSIISLVKLFSKSKILFICHNVVEHEAHPVKSLLSKAALGLGDAFIVHSTQEKESLTRLTGKLRVTVVFPPLYEPFHTAPIQKDQAKRKLGIRDERVLLFFGFVREYKGLRYIIEALPAIRRKFNVRLLIAGEFWEDKKTYLRLIEESGLEEKVTIIDRYIPNEDIPLYFCAADLAVLPYTSVTGSGALQLAKGFHVPAVVTNIGSFSEIVTDKRTGFHVPPRDSKAIAAAVIDFFENWDGEKMSREIEQDNRRFSWPAMVQAIEDFALGGKR